MSNAVDLFQEGKLSDAVSAATDAVRNNPSDVSARSALCELLCFSGDLDRADKQLEAAAQIDANCVVGVSLIRHLIRSEMCRREVFEKGRLPEFLTQPTDAQQRRLKALIAVSEGASGEAERLIAEAAELEAEISGNCDGATFEGFRDLDDLLGPTIEIFTATGQYYWLAPEQVLSLEFSSIEHLTDMLWRAAQIITIGDVSGRVHVPALYHGSHTAADERVRIGRTTDWTQTDGGSLVLGSGLREWLIGEDAVAITQLKEIEFRTAEA